MEQKHKIPSSPLPNQSSLLKDISNFKTPKPRTNPNSTIFNLESPCSQFFSASKQTPGSASTVRRRPRYSLAAQKVKKVELEMSKSSRKTEKDKEKALKSLAKSLTVCLISCLKILDLTYPEMDIEMEYMMMNDLGLIG